MKSPELKSLNYLKRKFWVFENDKQSAKDLKDSFINNRGGYKTVVESIIFLITKRKNWGFYTLNDIKNLNEARKIFIRNYEKII